MVSANVDSLWDTTQPKNYQVRAAFTSPITGSKWTLLFLFATKGGIREMAVFSGRKEQRLHGHVEPSPAEPGLVPESQRLTLPNALPAGRLGLHPARAGPYQPGKHRRDTAGHPGTGTGRLHPAFQRTGRERTAARCRLCDLRAAAACSYIGFTYIGKSNVGESHAGKPYVGKSNAIKYQIPHHGAAFHKGECWCSPCFAAPSPWR